ncbi:hypothetical protein ASD28_17360 [Massilia sp. Root133]|uniref:Cap15 family cyclic dinucleotide receptor domain-containing protein n=1 Tax=unclassified Massilia TaxID=2609279 RepID=UPI0006F61765|nr:MULTISPECIES: hypothetical protein [unclassified Massilia]KQX96859.1 hypothetical protein ASD28_17360 [Massilia sp. Root133]KQZ52567.1 hypothetical protein ASD92_18790 [Massilia sp. Root1485]
MVTQQDHEYTMMGGVNRAKIGRYLSLASSTISAGLVFLLLTAVDLAKKFHLPVNVPPAVLSLVGAGAVFGALYWLLNSYMWRWPGVTHILKVPDLSGTWDCVGESLGPNAPVPPQWNGEVTVVQTWDKLRIRLKTAHSGSSSMAAALGYDSVDGFVLLYQYRNDPNIVAAAAGMASHMGCAVVTITKDLKSASAEYFNGGSRLTFGKMSWTKRT